MVPNVSLPAGAVSQSLTSDEHVSRVPPRNLVDADDSLFSHEYERTIGATSLYELYDISILSNGFMAQNGRLVLDYFFDLDPPSLWRSRAKAALSGHYLKARSRGVPCDRRILYFTEAGSRGFFHWFGDALQKLEAVDHNRPELMGVPFFVPHGLPPFAHETLAAYPIGLVSIQRNQKLHAKHVTVLSRVAPTGNFRPDLMNSMRARLRSHFGLTGMPSRRIYVSRQDAPRRRVANEDEIRPVLAKHGVEFVSMAGLSYAEQAACLGEAELVVGLHGAGLTHMILMRPDTRVLELRTSGDSHSNCYFSLASAIGINYWYLGCKSANSKNSTHDGDVFVDSRELDETLSALG